MVPMYDEIFKLAETIGFQKHGETKGRLVPCDASLRRFCEQNVCGKYKSCYMCPPAAGSAETLIAKLHNYNNVIVFTQEYPCEDMSKYEAVQIAHERRSQMLWKSMQKLGYSKENACVLTSGGCHLCEKCGILTGEPCRHPDTACPSVSGYCIEVAKLAASLGLSTTGENGGIVFFCFVLLR